MEILKLIPQVTQKKNLKFANSFYAPIKLTRETQNLQKKNIYKKKPN